jgi:hypothetical protein
MRFLNSLPWIALGGLMILHGFAHTPGILGSWNLATFDDVTRQPNVLFTNAGDGLLYVLGFIWFAAAISFVIAGIGVLRQAVWWPMMTAVALVLSLGVTLLWHQDAFIGLVLNAILLAIMAGLYLLGQFERRRFA